MTRAIAYILAACLLPWSQEVAAEFTRSSLLAPKGLARSIAEDLNGDGLADLIFLAEKEIHIFRQRPTGFGEAPDEVLALSAHVGPMDVGLGAWPKPPQGDAQYDSRAPMLVMICVGGVYGFPQRDGRFARDPICLAETATLFSAPPEKPSTTDFVLDLNGDGVEEVLVPYRGGVHLFVPQEPFRLEHVQSIALEWASGWQARRAWCPIPKGGWSGRYAPVLSHTAGVSLSLEDWDRDGRLDIRSGRSDWHTRKAVHGIRLQKPDGTFEAEPSTTCQWVIDFDVGQKLRDLDGDGRPELVSTSRLRERWLPWMVLLPETQSTFVYRLGSTGAFGREPTHRFTSNLVGHRTTFFDWNRDGLLDVITFHSHIRASAKEDIVRAIVDKTFRYTVAFHVSRNGGLPEQPTLAKTVTYRVNRLTMPFIVPIIETGADLNGDGLPDLVVETKARTLVGFFQRARGFGDRPDFKLRAPEGYAVDFTDDLNGDAAADVLFRRGGAKDTQVTVLLSKHK